MSRTNETRHIKWYETCKCKCRLDASEIKVYEIKDIFGILVIVNVNAINHMILVSI